MPTEEARNFREAAILAAEKLSTDIQQLAKDTTLITEFSKHTRYLLKILAVSVVLEFLLCVGLFGAFFYTRHTKDDIRVAKVAVYESCLESNKVRSAQTILWTAVLSDESVAHIPSVDKLRTITNESFTQRHCVKP